MIQPSAPVEPSRNGGCGEQIAAAQLRELAVARKLNLSKLNLYRALRSFASSVVRRKEMDA